MPHAWRSPGRWRAWLEKWAAADPWRGEAITRAFVDRAAIDWARASARLTSAEDRRLADGLRRLEGLRGDAGGTRDSGLIPPGMWAVSGVTGLALAQSISGLVLVTSALIDGTAGGVTFVQLALAAAFGAGAITIGAAALRDPRGVLLLAAFTLGAAAFIRPVVAALPQGVVALSTPLFLGVYPEVFVPAVLWSFAAVFPAVSRFAPADLLGRRAASVMWVVAGVLAVTNVLVAHGRLGEPFHLVQRDHEGNLFWVVFAALSLPATVVVLVRAHRAPSAERLKVMRLSAVLVGGCGPFLVAGIARLFPDLDAWMRSGPGRTWTDPIVLGPLMALPVLTAIAVLVDVPFELYTRWTTPDGTKGRAGAMRAALRRPFRARRLESHLTAALHRITGATRRAEITEALRSAMRAALGTDRLVIVDNTPNAPLRGLAALLTDARGPVPLSPGCEPFILLPREDRSWLETRGLALATNLRGPDGEVFALVLLGVPRRRGGYDGAERWFVHTLLIGASIAWAASGDAAPFDDGTRAELPPLLAGRYVVERRIGAGATSIVYLAHDICLGRPVALKTLTVVGPDGGGHLREEARTMAALDHPGLAHVYGVESWQGLPVMVMEYFRLGTLADRLRRGRLPVGTVLRIADALLDALVYLHARGVLHRDLKPGNIGITETGMPKLLDFGLATIDDTSAGTPAYMPPEALAGGPADEHLDRWAVARIISDACDPDLRLDAFLRRALAPRPADRYQSSESMRRALATVPFSRAARTPPPADPWR
jgi:hypothetical protein